MRNELACAIVMDLLPSYIDGILLDSVYEVVDEHLKECKECKEKLQQLKDELEENDNLSRKKEAVFLKTIKRHKYYVIGMAIGASIPIILLIIFIVWLMILV